jgi:glucose/arabinose dehydrogenase
MRLAASAGIVVAALVLATPAAAHPQFLPPFLDQNSATELLLAAPNERPVPMTAIELQAPPSVAIVGVGSRSAWHGELTGRRATWSGGSLATGKWGQFPVRLRASEAGSAAFTVRQRFADGRTVNWDLTLGVTPAAAAPEAEQDRSYGVATAAAVALGVVAGSVLLLLGLRRRSR